MQTFCEKVKKNAINRNHAKKHENFSKNTLFLIGCFVVRFNVRGRTET